MIGHVTRAVKPEQRSHTKNETGSLEFLDEAQRLVGPCDSRHPCCLMLTKLKEDGQLCLGLYRKSKQGE